MTKTLKTQWVEALRSGEYEQATGQLRKGDGFCCLGVLCDVLHKNGVGTWVETQYVLGDVEHSTRLPETVVDRMKSNSLIEMNDDDGASFVEIADWIEENLSVVVSPTPPPVTETKM